MVTFPLRLTEETQRLPSVAPDGLGGVRSGWAQVEPADPLGDAGINAWIAGRVSGDRAKGWEWRRFGLGTGPTLLYRAGPLWHLPGSGLLIGDDGALLKDSAAKTRSPQPDLAGLPGITRRDGTDIFTPPARAPRIAAASLFMPWGGLFNYGHFVIDGLSGLLALDEAGLLRDLPPIAPPLTRWQRGLLRLAFGDLKVREVKASVLRLEDVAYASNINHFLHQPNPLLGRLAERIRSRAPKSARRGRKLYLSRRGYSMRVMVNAAEVESALAARGFEIVEPHRISVEDQAALMAQAAVVVGPTGAGMTNALFTAPGAAVLEIQPENFASFWLGAACHAAGRDWHGFIVASPAPDRQSPWLARMRRGFRFGYRVPVAGLMKVLDRL